MPDRSETHLFPGRDEFLGLREAIERNAVAIRLQDSRDSRECWEQPARAIIICDFTSSTIAVTNQVRRIGDHQVDCTWLDRTENF